MLLQIKPDIDWRSYVKAIALSLFPAWLFLYYYNSSALVILGTIILLYNLIFILTQILATPFAIDKKILHIQKHIYKIFKLKVEQMLPKYEHLCPTAPITTSERKSKIKENHQHNLGVVVIAPKMIKESSAIQLKVRINE